MAMTDRDLADVIIRWLGPAYDAEGEMGLNPDYRTREDVDELVAAVRQVVAIYQREAQSQNEE